MALTRTRGATLMEMVIYLGLVAVVGLMITAIFAMTQQTQRTTASAYAVTGQADTAMIWIRQDLEETALGAIRVYPDRQAVTLISPRTPSSDEQPGTLRISEYGVPLWTKHVFYALKTPTGSATSELVRWEQPLTTAEMTRVPTVVTLPTVLALGNARTLLHNVVAPNQSVKGLGGLQNDTYTAPARGGFSVQFLRRLGGETGASSLSDVNPCQNAAASADNTRLVQVDLAIAEPSMGAPSFYTVRFRVAARY